ARRPRDKFHRYAGWPSRARRAEGSPRECRAAPPALRGRLRRRRFVRTLRQRGPWSVRSNRCGSGEHGLCAPGVGVNTCRAFAADDRFATLDRAETRAVLSLEL